MAVCKRVNIVLKYVALIIKGAEADLGDIKCEEVVVPRANGAKARHRCLACESGCVSLRRELLTLALLNALRCRLESEISESEIEFVEFSVR